MTVREMLASTGRLRSMANELGVTEDEAATGAEALAPAILGGFERQAAPSGSGGLAALLDKFGDGDLLDNVTSPAPTDLNRGNGILASIFGSKDVSRTVAQEASTKSGVGTAMLKKMLPIVAMMVVGHLRKKSRAATR